MMTLAITGRSGVGKSTVTAQLRAAGIPVADADQIARDVLAAGSPCLPLLQAAFGADICEDLHHQNERAEPSETEHTENTGNTNELGTHAQTGALNRRLLADRAFATPQGTAKLTEITHPEILRRIAAAQQAAKAAGEALFAIDGAVIIGSACEALCDCFVVVCAPLAQSIARITARDGITPQMAQRRLNAQLPEETLRDRADYIIENDGDATALTQQIETLMTNLRRDADATKAPL